MIETTLAPVVNAVVPAEPERAIGHLYHSEKSAPIQFGMSRPGKNRELIAVKPRNALCGGHPKIAVAGLDDVANLGGRQPLLRRPALDRIAVGLAVGIQG